MDRKLKFRAGPFLAGNLKKFKISGVFKSLHPLKLPRRLTDFDALWICYSPRLNLGRMNCLSMALVWVSVVAMVLVRVQMFG